MSAIPEFDRGTRGVPFSQLPAALRANDPAAQMVDQLLLESAEFQNDPRGFAYWNYPWGQEGTPLERFSGPDRWQDETLDEIGQKLRAAGDEGVVIRKAIRSGHGIGKSGLAAMLIGWAIATMARTRGVVTAMTELQLRTKTWSELAKWHSMSLVQFLFEVQGRSYIPKGTDDVGQELSRVWRIDAVPWSKDNPSAFAGLHNIGRRIIVIFDEASEIDDEIWRVTRGALTDKFTQIIWLVMGQPTQTSGEFFRCFGSSLWNPRTIDSRESRFVDKTTVKQLADELGEESDFFRVRVMGLPPRAGINNFIPYEIVTDAQRRRVDPTMWRQMPKRLAVDPARFGDDLSVVTLRQGQIIVKKKRYSGLDGPNLASAVMIDFWQENRDITGCAVDAIGIGASCADALRRIEGFPLLEVNVAAPATEQSVYFNLRAELWARMRKWLESAELPDRDTNLAEQLTSVKYGLDGKSRIQLEAKKDIKARGLPSPDDADSLALTFFQDAVIVKPVAKARTLPVHTRPVNIWSRRR